MKIKLPQTWNTYLKLLKIGAVLILIFIIVAEPPVLKKMGIRSYETLWLIGVIMFLFIFSTAYQFFSHATPSIRAFQKLRSIQNEVIHFIPITHYSVYLRILSNDLLYLFFASNLIYLSFRIEMVKLGGIILGILLIGIHVYSFTYSILNLKLIGIYLTNSALAYYEYTMEYLPWDSIRKIKRGGLFFHIYEQNEEMHELDFEDEEKYFAPFYEILKEKADFYKIDIEEIPEEDWIKEGFTPSLDDKKT